MWQSPPAVTVTNSSSNFCMYAELRGHLEQMALLPHMGASPHATAMISDLFRGTYFYMMQGSTLTLTRRGTRPGDPAADAIFSLTMAARPQPPSTGSSASHAAARF